MNEIGSLLSRCCKGNRDSRNCCSISAVRGSQSKYISQRASFRRYPCGPIANFVMCSWKSIHDSRNSSRCLYANTPTTFSLRFHLRLSYDSRNTDHIMFVDISRIIYCSKRATQLQLKTYFVLTQNTPIWYRVFHNKIILEISHLSIS